MTYSITTLQSTTRTVSEVEGRQTRIEYPATPEHCIYREGNVCICETVGGTATLEEVETVCSGFRLWREKIIRAEGDKKLTSIATPYMEAERSTWDRQQQQAEAWLKDPNANIPLITAIAQTRGVPIAELVELIMSNVQLFEPVCGAILGEQQALLGALYRAQTIDEVLSVGWA